MYYKVYLFIIMLSVFMFSSCITTFRGKEVDYNGRIGRTYPSDTILIHK